MDSIIAWYMGLPDEYKKLLLGGLIGGLGGGAYSMATDSENPMQNILMGLVLGSGAGYGYSRLTQPSAQPQGQPGLQPKRMPFSLYPGRPITPPRLPAQPKVVPLVVSNPWADRINQLSQQARGQVQGSYASLPLTIKPVADQTRREMGNPR